jgi:LPS O-antigen subunit length determinant protein (WzzB/FepE family)
MIKELESLKESLDDTELLMILEMLESENDINLQNDVNYDTVNNMDSSVENKLSLMKRFINWLIPDEEVSKSEETDIIASTETVEAENDTKEDEYMDIDILKEALGTVIDQRLTDFAASIKEEVDASVTTKINELAKGFEDKSAELAEKLASAEKALAEQTEKVEAYASAGAIKKSVDPEDEDDAEELSKSESKSFWGNVYLPEALVKSLGYKS